MGLKQETRVIDGVEYKVTQLTASKGRAVLVRLFKLAGPAFGQLLDGVELKDTSKITAFGKAIQEVSERMVLEDLEFLVETFAPTTQVKTGPGLWPDLSQIQEIHFAGEYPRMLKWLWFALQVNYRGFFSGPGVAAILAQFKAGAAPSASPATSTGPSGDS